MFRKWYFRATILIWSTVLVIGLYAGPFALRLLLSSSVPISPTLRVVLGGGGNTVILKSADNRQVLIVDTKLKFTAYKIKQALGRLEPNAQITIVNTHEHPDHIQGNALFPQATVISGIGAGTGKTLIIGDETVKIYNVGQAHAWDNLMVYFEKHRLLVTGDLVFNHIVPVVIPDGGADIGKWIKALEYISKVYPAAMVVPGHGGIADQRVLREQLDYFKSISAAVGNPQQLARLEKKYADYLTLPGWSRINGVVKAVEEERAETASGDEMPGGLLPE